MPPDNGGDVNNFDLIDRPVPVGTTQPTAPWPGVTPEYFRALGVPLLEGRLFTPADTAGAPPVAVVSRAWARHYFPDGTAVGRRLISGGCTSCPPTVIVGIVGDVKYLGLNGGSEAVYESLTAGWYRSLILFVRSAAAPAGVRAPVLAALRSVDPDIPLNDAVPMVDRLYGSVAAPRHWMFLLGGFAVTAVLLSAVGIFGLLSYTVRTRRREIGVRMALGAERSTVVRMIVGRGMIHALTGTLIGLAVALAGTRSLANNLFQLSPTDPVTLLAVTALLLLTALLACLIPARRAASVNPVEAIRLE
jgi:putative ABC transport system permease protein